MAAKKENLKESLKEEKQDEVITVDGEKEASLSSLDLLWRHAFHELDEWAKCTDNRDDVCLKEVRRFSESVQRNQGNIKAIAEQFTKELTEWEKIARDEFLMSTTTLQHFFPIWSYEEMNAHFDQIQKTVLSLLSTPCQTMANCQAIEKYLEMIGQYIDLRKKGRMQYIKTVKQAGNSLYEYQKGFVNLFATQFKELIFPLNKYMEKTEEPTNS
ncbi:hypothetical protein HFZ78_13915 [Priestia megaterium]|uniref:Uncharacterized protein n=1 Tax=Priestia megaterium TaxID=1404 RepID=A0A6H1P2C5_PRIMG|nr:hypothetical protein [Priestia megaterium]QIZ07696.1 hypothetical protein HFZ78_13915 [Priestia megaterium]